jgi:glycosyltransferase involved in cell wall biosynthesis
VAFIDVVDVTIAEPDPRLLWSSLDLPKPGTRLEGRVLEVAGWALGRDGPVAGIECVVGDLTVRRALNATRPDLAEGFPHVSHAAGAGFLVEVELPRSAAAVVEVRALVDGPPAAIGVVRAERRWRRSADPALRDLVSVVIPCFDQAHLLGEAIESVLAQSHEDVELVVVDDGSTDNTAAVAGRYDRVRYVRQDNQGLAAARNTGIRETNGDLLVFLDADDVLLAGALEQGVRSLHEHPECAFAFGHVAFLMEDATEPPAPYTPSFPGDCYEHFLRGRTIAAPGAVMFRRAALQASGVFSGAHPAAADYDLYCRIARDHPVHCHGAVVAGYRRHASSMSTDAASMLRATLGVLREHRAAAPWAEARRTGIRYWKRFYGEQITWSAQRHVQAGRWGRALRDALVLARHWPRGLLPLVRSRRRLTQVQTPYDPDPPV